LYIFGELECVDHSFAYVAHFVFLEMSKLDPREQARFQLSHPSPQLSHPSPHLNHPSPHISHNLLNLATPSPQLSQPLYLGKVKLSLIKYSLEKLTKSLKNLAVA
jgi:hypothetical protein